MRNATPSLVLVLVLLAVLYALGAGRGGGAACSASLPELKSSLSQATRSETFRLRGKGFYGDFVCEDTGPPVSSRPAGGLPTGGIRVEFLQDKRVWTIATVASDENLEFDAGGLKVPADAVPGRAVVRATSPSVDPLIPPLRAETPLLVLDDLPGTGGTKTGAGAVEGR